MWKLVLTLMKQSSPGAGGAGRGNRRPLCVAGGSYTYRQEKQRNAKVGVCIWHTRGATAGQYA